MVEAVGGARAGLLDAVGLGLLATAAFTWSVSAGFVVAGVAVLAFNWRLEQGSE
ncbi:hypothetical protein [Streptomyces sp. Amel2xC10]|uniref:hypothetical protein n=1 Tax=Streptomyces sp. Amel2xC10 TaxID=1305826 RepID=UPI0015C478D7|nr:hypothetical protein [Streptomyces sp. Amel2xC10]